MAKTHTSGPYKQATPECDVCHKTYFRTIIPFESRRFGAISPSTVKLFGFQIDYICTICDEELWYECTKILREAKGGDVTTSIGPQD